MTSRSIMVYRAVIQRNTSVSDEGGGSTESWADTGDAVPCYAWAASARQILESSRPEVEKTRIVLMPKRVDVRTGDRLVSVTDRKGGVLFDGPLLVDAIGERTDHWQLTTRKIA